MRYQGVIAAALGCVCILICYAEPVAAQSAAAESTPTAFSSNADISTVIRRELQQYPGIQRAYLVRYPHSPQPFLILVFDKAPVQGAIDDAMAAYARVVPDSPPLGIILPAKKTWKRDTAGIDPFYVRP